MDASILQEIDALSRATVTELRERYQEVFGEASRSFHKQFLFRRIAWRLPPSCIRAADLCTER